MRMPKFSNPFRSNRPPAPPPQARPNASAANAGPPQLPPLNLPGSNLGVNANHFGRTPANRPATPQQNPSLPPPRPNTPAPSYYSGANATSRPPNDVGSRPGTATSQPPGYNQIGQRPPEYRRGELGGSFQQEMNRPGGLYTSMPQGRNSGSDIGYAPSTRPASYTDSYRPPSSQPSQPGGHVQDPGPSNQSRPSQPNNSNGFPSDQKFPP